MKNSYEKQQKPVTQNDVAKHAGVSRSIVSYVLNGSPRPVAPETKARIIKAIEELDYRPNKFAQKLMKSKYNAVAEKQFGIVMADVFMLRRPYYADILAGVHSTTHEKDHHIRFLRFFSDLKDPLLFNELIHHEEISGLILLALDQSIHTEEDYKIIKQITNRIRNIVCVEWELENIPSVTFNRQEAAYKACSHLLSLGHKNIIYIGPDDSRVLGYRQAYNENNLDENRICYYSGSTLADGFNRCKTLINDHSFPDAILGGTDEVSIGILHCLSEKGISVPDNVALVSIDNIEMSAYTNPALTSVNVQTDIMGKTAVQLLINHAREHTIIPAATVLPTQLIIRDSCGAKRIFK